LEKPLVELPEKIAGLPSLDVFFQLDIAGVFTSVMIGPIFVLIFTDMFDSISTFIGVAHTAKLLDKKGRTH
jgi:adenine/guanine/hypoxanthine permease